MLSRVVNSAINFRPLFNLMKAGRGGRGGAGRGASRAVPLAGWLAAAAPVPAAGGREHPLHRPALSAVRAAAGAGAPATANRRQPPCCRAAALPRCCPAGGRPQHDEEHGGEEGRAVGRHGAGAAGLGCGRCCAAACSRHMLAVVDGQRRKQGEGRGLQASGARAALLCVGCGLAKAMGGQQQVGAPAVAALSHAHQRPLCMAHLDGCPHTNSPSPAEAFAIKEEVQASSLCLRFILAQPPHPPPPQRCLPSRRRLRTRRWPTPPTTPSPSTVRCCWKGLILGQREGRGGCTGATLLAYPAHHTIPSHGGWGLG